MNTDYDAVLQQCLCKTRNYSANWMRLGFVLKVKEHLLKEIEKNYPRDVDTCRIKMLPVWLKDNNPADPEAELEAALKEFQKTAYKG